MELSQDLAGRVPRPVFDALLLLSAARYEMAAIQFESWAATCGGGGLPETPCVEWLGEVLTLRQETRVGRGRRSAAVGAQRLFDSAAFPRAAAAVGAAAARCASGRGGGGGEAPLESRDRRCLEVFAQLRWSEKDHATAAVVFERLCSPPEALDGRHAKSLATCCYFLGRYAAALTWAARCDSPFLSYCARLVHGPTLPAGFAARADVAKRSAAALGKEPRREIPYARAYRGEAVSLGWLASPSLRLRGADPTLYDDTSLFCSARGEGDGFVGGLAASSDGGSRARLAADFDDAKAKRMDGVYAIAFCTGPENYYHLLWELGAKLAALVEARGDDPLVAECLDGATWLVPASQGDALVLELFRYLGLKAPALYDPTAPLAFGDAGGAFVLDAAAVGRTEADGAPSLHDACTPAPGALRALRRALGHALCLDHVLDAAVPNPSGGDVGVYVSRRGSGSRGVAVERLLVDALKAWAAKRRPSMRWIVFYGAPATLAEQATLFSRASLVVSPHGAGLANLAFAPPNCKVVELPIRANANKMFQFGCRTLGLDYRVSARITALYTGHYALTRGGLREVGDLLDALCGYAPMPLALPPPPPPPVVTDDNPAAAWLREERAKAGPARTAL